MSDKTSDSKEIEFHNVTDYLQLEECSSLLGKLIQITACQKHYCKPFIAFSKK